MLERVRARFRVRGGHFGCWFCSLRRGRDKQAGAVKAVSVMPATSFFVPERKMVEVQMHAFFAFVISNEVLAVVALQRKKPFRPAIYPTTGLFGLWINLF